MVCDVERWKGNSRNHSNSITDYLSHNRHAAPVPTSFAVKLTPRPQYTYSIILHAISDMPSACH